MSDAERVRDVHDAFYKLTVMQRDAAWSEVAALRAELAQAKSLMAKFEELRAAADQLYFAARNVELMQTFREQFPYKAERLSDALTIVRPILAQLDPNPINEEDEPC